MCTSINIANLLSTTHLKATAILKYKQLILYVVLNEKVVSSIMYHLIHVYFIVRNAMRKLLDDIFKPI